MSLSRRELLVMGTASVLALLPAELRAALPPPKAQFGEHDLAVLRALAEALYGPGSEELPLIPALQETLGFLDESQQEVLASLPSLFDTLSRVLVPTGAPFAELSVEARVAALEDWLDSPLAFRRQVGQALRQIVLAHCYTQEAVWADISYPGPWLGRIELPLNPLRFGEPE